MPEITIDLLFKFLAKACPRYRRRRADSRPTSRSVVSASRTARVRGEQTTRTYTHRRAAIHTVRVVHARTCTGTRRVRVLRARGDRGIDAESRGPLCFRVDGQSPFDVRSDVISHFRAPNTKASSSALLTSRASVKDSYKVRRAIFSPILYKIILNHGQS